jgi:low temperature requirement protein LtrA
VIIALGESIVITGATATDLDLTLPRMVAFGLAFIASAAMWWLYFDYAAAMAQRRLALAERRTWVARDAFTYLHVLIVAGVIVDAVGDELAIAHPTEVLPGAEVAAIVAGPAIYLFATSLFRRRMAGTWSGKRLTGALACVAAGGIGAFAAAWVVLALTVAILAAVITAERIAGARRRARGELAPHERLAAAAGQADNI